MQRLLYGATVLQKTVGNFYYVSVIHTVYTVSGQSKYLNVYNSFILCPMLFIPYVLGLESVYTSIHVPCL